MKFSELDSIDRKILHILQEDSTLTVKELAMRVNLSTSPTFDRQKRLEREGFIKGYHAILDAKKTDNGMTVLCNMRLKRHSQMLIYFASISPSPERSIRSGAVFKRSVSPMIISGVLLGIEILKPSRSIEEVSEA